MAEGPALNLPLFEETYTVSQLCGEVRELLGTALPAVWVSGEINRLRVHRRGHLYFELVEKGAGDQIVGKLEAVAWRTDHQAIRAALTAAGVELAEGQEIRCRAGVDFYAPFGRLQLVVREVDTVFAMGLLARRRQETLAALAAAGLLERNRGLELPAVPLRVALVTSQGSAAFHDFLSTLRESGYGFQVLFLHASVQGREAEREVASALGALAGARVDCVALIRGGGSRADLAVFDSRRIAEAVARAPVPVLTGLGHEIDQAIADLAAHTALKTPTKVAELLVGRVREADQRVAQAALALRRAAPVPVQRGRQALHRAERGVALARFRLAGAATRLEDLRTALGRGGRRLLGGRAVAAAALGRRLAQGAPRLLERRRSEPHRLGRAIAGRGRAAVRAWGATLEGWTRLCGELAPRRTLARGFSITRDDAGRLLRQPGQVGPGDRLTTELAAGTVRSRVEGT